MSMYADYIAIRNWRDLMEYEDVFDNIFMVDDDGKPVIATQLGYTDYDCVERLIAGYSKLQDHDYDEDIEWLGFFKLIGEKYGVVFATLKAAAEYSDDSWRPTGDWEYHSSQAWIADTLDELFDQLVNCTDISVELVAQAIKKHKSLGRAARHFFAMRALRGDAE